MQRLHGTLSSALGEPATKLSAQFMPRMHRGLWRPGNVLFRGQAPSAAATTANANPDAANNAANNAVDALQLLGTDIAGHALGFEVDANGRLALKCVDLLVAADKNCKVSSQHWMHNLEANWAWQNARQAQLWPTEAPGAGGGPVAWTCPLRMLRTHAGTQDRETMRSPSRARNAFRFAHITAPHTYAHPIVAGARNLLLMPARFISETQACTASAADSTTVCHSAELLARTIAHARELLWQTVTFPKDHNSPGVSCAQVLDCLHQPFLTWDSTRARAPSTSACTATSSTASRSSSCSCRRAPRRARTRAAPPSTQAACATWARCGAWPCARPTLTRCSSTAAPATTAPCAATTTTPRRRTATCAASRSSRPRRRRCTRWAPTRHAKAPARCAQHAVRAVRAAPRRGLCRV